MGRAEDEFERRSSKGRDPVLLVAEGLLSLFGPIERGEMPLIFKITDVGMLPDMDTFRFSSVAGGGVIVFSFDASDGEEGDDGC